MMLSGTPAPLPGVKTVNPAPSRSAPMSVPLRSQEARPFFQRSAVSVARSSADLPSRLASPMSTQGCEVGRGQVGEGQQQVGHVPLGIQDQGGDAGAQRLFQVDDAETGLAGPGHPDDHPMGGEVVGVVVRPAPCPRCACRCRGRRPRPDRSPCCPRCCLLVIRCECIGWRERTAPGLYSVATAPRRMDMKARDGGLGGDGAGGGRLRRSGGDGGGGAAPISRSSAGRVSPSSSTNRPTRTEIGFSADRDSESGEAFDVTDALWRIEDGPWNEPRSVASARASASNWGSPAVQNEARPGLLKERVIWVSCLPPTDG